MRPLNEVRARIAEIFTSNGVGNIEGDELGETLTDLSDNIEARSAWQPIFGAVAYNGGVIFQVVDWVGSAGNLNPKPAVGKYIGMNGFVATQALAVNMQGPPGPTGAGVAGPKGDPGTMVANVFPTTTVKDNKFIVIQNGSTLERMTANQLPYMDASGNLGIGNTLTAVAITTVGGISTIHATNLDGYTIPTVNAAGEARLLLGANAIPGSSDLAFINTNLFGFRGMSFWSMLTGGVKQLLLSLRDGKVGIGITVPEYPLHIKQTNETTPDGTGISIHNDSDGQIPGAKGARMIFSMKNVGFWAIGMLGNSSTFVINGWTAAGTFVEHMRINPFGLFGVGTDNPLEKLDVNGRIRSQGLVMAQGGSINATPGPALGTGGSPSAILQNALDSVGQIYLGTGTSAGTQTGGGAIAATISFGAAKSAAPRMVILQAANQAAASQITKVYVADLSVNGFTIRVDTPLSHNNGYTFGYFVIY